jgi:S-adenosylmethionine:tRNA ribosyltransferase-isomerase
MALRDGLPEDPRLRPYHYELPDMQIARHPPAMRDGGRMLHVGADGLSDRQVRELPMLLQPGDLLVVNDTRVLSARIAARRRTGGKVEVLLLGGEGDVVEAMVRPGRRLSAGETLSIDGDDELAVVLEERRPDGTWRVRPIPDPATVMARAGVVPLPPYLRRDAEPEDAVRYQTVFAGPLGAVAAPTAGLHLTTDLLAEAQRRGVEVAHLTLHVGAGTFRNLRPEDLERGRLHREALHVPEQTAAAVDATRRRGGRVVAVGTTATRALEARALPGRRVQAGSGHTDLFLQPGARFGVVDALLTNLHLPGSSLLMLVCAFGGRDRVLAAYQHAVAGGYRFFSYGDAMLLTAPQWETG